VSRLGCLQHRLEFVDGIATAHDADTVSADLR
jgi:hypothetical protein